MQVFSGPYLPALRQIPRWMQGFILPGMFSLLNKGYFIYVTFES